MQVGIVSDTHDNVESAEWAADVFAEAGVDAVVHCGDVIAPFSATPFRELAEGGPDFYCARGNNDGEWNLQSAVQGFGTYLGEMGELTLGGAEVAVYHGTSGPIVDALVDCGHYDYVLHGHTHTRAHEERDGTVRINPGGIPYPGNDEGFSVALLDTDGGEVRFEHADEE